MTRALMLREPYDISPPQGLLKRLLSHFAYDESPAVRTRICCVVGGRLGRKPSYGIRLALDSASPPSLSIIAKAEGLSKQTVFRLKQDPQAALAAWGL
jgi:hypothetical protein